MRYCLTICIILLLMSLAGMASAMTERGYSDCPKAEVFVETAIEITPTPVTSSSSGVTQLVPKFIVDDSEYKVMVSPPIEPVKDPCNIIGVFMDEDSTQEEKQAAVNCSRQ